MLNDAEDFMLMPDVPDSIKIPKKAPLEKHVEARLVDRVRSAGGVSWKFVSINNRGVSDRIVLMDGRVIFVELKRDGGKLSPLQRLFRDKVLDNGGEFALVEGMGGVDRFVKKLRADRSFWKIHFRAIGAILRLFKGAI